jgi:hypothetical protein
MPSRTENRHQIRFWQFWHGFWLFGIQIFYNTTRRRKLKSRAIMFDLENLLQLGVFNQLIPVWHVFFFIAGLLPFLLLNRLKICLLITYLFTFYLGFMVQWGDYIASTGSMQPFVLYSFSGLAIAVFFVATIFTESPEKETLRWSIRHPVHQDNVPAAEYRGDPLDHAVNVTQSSEGEGFTSRLR